MGSGQQRCHLLSCGGQSRQQDHPCGAGRRIWWPGQFRPLEILSGDPASAPTALLGASDRNFCALAERQGSVGAQVADLLSLSKRVFELWHGFRDGDSLLGLTSSPDTPIGLVNGDSF